MKILLVTELFAPDKGVSTLRLNFFYKKLLLNHDVDVLKLGNKTSFDCAPMQLDRKYFKSFQSAVFNRRRIFKVVAPLLVRYDLVLVSLPSYFLGEVANAARRLRIPYILDLRDQPDLVVSDQKKRMPMIWLRAKNWITESYLLDLAKSSVALTCVGAISTALMQNKLLSSSVRVVNVHNGFERSDVDFLKAHARTEGFFKGSRLILGCVGSLHSFRDTQDLRSALARLNQMPCHVVFRHWGGVSADLKIYFESLDNVSYVSEVPLPREKLFEELAQVDCFLLACSDDLIWEPTTSVFDYILFSKPILFTGLKNNEAYSILENTGKRIFDSNSVFDILSCVGEVPLCVNHAVNDIYSRECSFERLNAVIEGFLKRRMHEAFQ